MKSPLKLIALFSCDPSWSSPWGSPSESWWSRGWNSKSFATTWGVHSEPKLKILFKKVMGKISLSSPVLTNFQFLNKIFNFWQFLKGIECSASKTDPSINAKKQDNRLYGLHALNNLDIAVNGKEVNSMPSYQEIRRNSFGSNSIISDQPSASQQHPTSGIPVLRPTPNGETPPKVKNLCYFWALKLWDYGFWVMLTQKLLKCLL